MMFDARATPQVRQLRQDYGFNTQHTGPRRDELAIPQYNSQMGVDTLHTPPLVKPGESTWKASCDLDLATQLSKITAYLRSCVLQRPRLSCIADSGISSIEKTNTIGHVSTSPQISSSAVAPKRGASELSSSARARPYVHQSRPSKRLQGNDDDSDRDDEEPKASTSKRARSKITQHQFACPFWKLDPNKQRSCYSATLSEIRYVKQHILRRHVQPIHCVICMEIFDSNEDYTVHLRQRSCTHDQSSKPEPEGINPAQKQVLLSWRAKRGSSKEEQWFELWKILFPTLPSPCSPFMDEEVLTQSHPVYVPERLNEANLSRVSRMSSNKWNKHRGLPSLGTDADEKVNRERRFPCPYYQRFPQRFCSSRWRSCSGPGWPTMDLLEDHIYSCHAAPLSTCPRCREPFDSKMDQVEHLKAEKICLVREEPLEMEWLSKDKKKRLQQGFIGTNEADKWGEMYRILFSGVQETPSPYHEELESQGEWKDPEFQGYAEYLDRELPRRIRRELGQRVIFGLGLLSDRATNQLVDIVREAQVSLLQQYKSSVPSESNHEWMETRPAKDMHTEISNSPNLTYNARTQPHTPYLYNIGAYEDLSASNAILPTYQSHEDPIQPASSPIDFGGWDFESWDISNSTLIPLESFRSRELRAADEMAAID